MSDIICAIGRGHARLDAQANSHLTCGVAEHESDRRALMESSQRNLTQAGEGNFGDIFVLNHAQSSYNDDGNVPLAVVSGIAGDVGYDVLLFPLKVVKDLFDALVYRIRFLFASRESPSKE